MACVYKMSIKQRFVLLFSVACLRLVVADTGSSFPRDAFAVGDMVSFKSCDRLECWSVAFFVQENPFVIPQ